MSFGLKILAVSPICQSNIVDRETSPSCAAAEDFLPCTCHDVITPSNQSRLVVNCDEFKNIAIVNYWFRRIRLAQEIYAFHMTIPESVKSFGFQDGDPHFYFGSNIIRNIHLTCQSNETVVSLLPNNPYTRLVKYNLYIEHIQTDNCQITNIALDLHLLKKLTVSRMRNFRIDIFNFDRLTSFTTLHVTHLSEFQSFSNDLSSLSHLTNLAIDYCPRVAKYQFLTYTFKLQRLSMNGNQMNDSAVAEALGWLSLETKETLRTLSVMDNRLTQIPEVKMFSNLTTLLLDKNNITKLKKGSLLQFIGDQIRTISLSSCGMDFIEHGALEGS